MSESSLLPKEAAFFPTNVSIRTLAHMTADQLAVAAKEVVAQFEARSGYSYRNAVSGGDPTRLAMSSTRSGPEPFAATPCRSPIKHR